jgi:peptidoglycan/LPS O-acetylase OafA/YrhL
MQSVVKTQQILTPKLYRPLSLDTSGIAKRLRDNNFDALRLIFASMVVVFHTGLLSQVSSLTWTSHISATFAVQAFFVVSGFLVTMSFENSSSVKSYVSKRLRRIAPAYVLVILAAALCLSMMSILPAHKYFTDPELRRYLAFNLLLSNFSAPNLPGVFQSNFITAVNSSLWTIKIEVAFYCLVPFMVWAVRRFGYRKVLSTVFIASILWKLGFDAASTITGMEIYAKFAKQLPGQLCFFAGGAWAFYRTREAKTINPLLAAMGAVIYAVSGWGWFYDIIAPAAVTAIVYWAAIAGPRLPAVAKRGDFSYGVYLYHFPLVQTITALGVFRWSALGACMIVVAVVGMSAALSWQFVERPILHRNTARG